MKNKAIHVMCLNYVPDEHRDTDLCEVEIFHLECSCSSCLMPAGTAACSLLFCHTIIDFLKGTGEDLF